MPRLTFGAFALSILLGNVGTCFATPAEDYIDDKLLSQGTGEVGVMNAQQLEAFIDYLAVCDAMGSAKDDQKFNCDVATHKFRMKNINAAALYRIVRAMDLTWLIVEHSEGAATAADRGKIATYIMRRVEIFRELQSSASARYAALITH
jgi:hypothetical protein